MKKCGLLLVFFIFSPHLSNTLFSKLNVALQPFDLFDKETVRCVIKGLEDMYDCRVDVLGVIDLPAKTYYKSRQRYRAPRILQFLRNTKSRSYDKVVGLTRRDISCTKGKYFDWGIFGYAYLGGDAGIVSTFRLKKPDTAQTLFLERLVKVVNHEFGHMLGLDHCTSKKCLMADAVGTIKTVDEGKNRLCAYCTRKIHHLLKK